MRKTNNDIILSDKPLYSSPRTSDLTSDSEAFTASLLWREIQSANSTPVYCSWC